MSSPDRPLTLFGLTALK